MTLWMLVLGCGGGSAESAPVSGCWAVLPKRTTVECFEAGGVYTLKSPSLGSFEGTWTLDGESVSITVGGTNPDIYAVTRTGDRLVLENEKRSMELVRHTP